jgi:hypothetical protein
MGLFSVRGRLPQPAGYKSSVDSEPSLPHVARRIGALTARLGLSARAAIRNSGGKIAAGLREARLAAIAATNDARIVAVLLLLATVALGLEMAASFHLI